MKIILHRYIFSGVQLFNDLAVYVYTLTQTQLKDLIKKISPKHFEKTPIIPDTYTSKEP